MPTHKTLYYPVWLSHGATPPYMIGKPCDTISEASAERRRIAAEYGERGFPCRFSAVLRFGQGKHTLILSTIEPSEARKAVTHYLKILDQFHCDQSEQRP